MSSYAQLQFNQAGAWRGVLVFRAVMVPAEFLKAAEDLVRLSGGDARMRIVACEQDKSNGTYVATRTVLMSWERKQGWVNA